MLCPHCSEPVQEGSFFCASCGMKLDEQSPVVSTQGTWVVSTDSGGSSSISSFKSNAVHVPIPTQLDEARQEAQQAADSFVQATAEKYGAILARRATLVSRLDAERLEVIRSAVDATNTRLAQALQTVRASAQVLENGPLEPEAAGLASRIAQYLEVGRLQMPVIGDCPAIVPFLGHGHVVLEGQLAACGPFLREIVWQVASGTSPEDLEVLVFNPRASSDLAPFAQLPNIRIFSDARELETVVHNLKDDGIQISNAIGDSDKSLVEYRSETGSMLGRMRVLVLLDYPERLDARIGPEIEDLFERGQMFGLSLVVHLSSEALQRKSEGDRSLQWFDIAKHLVNAEHFKIDDSEVVAWCRFEDVPLTYAKRDNAAIAAAVSGWSQQLLEAERLRREREAAEQAEIARRMQARIRLLPLQHPEQDWTESSKDGITLAAIESDGKVVHEIVLDDAHTHAILLGGTGSGKSNFILSLIYGMSQRYAPSEVRFYALDFKEGLSMATLAPGFEGDDYLPHARLLGVNSDRRFGVEVLQMIIGECHRRSELFKDAGVQKISDYRDAGYPMSRIVLIIDEFQLLFQGSDAIARQAGDDIEFIARQGRSAGVHMILATQTLSGMIRDTTFKRDIMLQQMKIRMCLSSNLLDQIVDIHTANSTILKKYEVLINDNDGLTGFNHIALTPPVEDEVASELQNAWTIRSVSEFGQRVEPLIFNGALPCTFEDIACDLISLRDTADQRPYIDVVLGRRVSLAGSPYSHVELAGNIAVMGAATTQLRNVSAYPVDIMEASSVSRRGQSEVLGESVVAIVQIAAICAAIQDPGALLLVFDGMNSSTAAEAHMSEWFQFMETALGANIVNVSRDNMVSVFSSLTELVGSPVNPESGHTYIFGFDMGSIFELSQDALDSAGKKMLTQVLKLGPSHGVHSVIWWSDAQGMKSNLGNLPDSGIRFSASVLLDINSGDLPSVVPKEDGIAKWFGQDNRALVCNPISARGDLIIPVVPSDAMGLNRLAQELGRR